MRNQRLPALALAGAFAAFLTGAAATSVTAREYTGDRSWNGSSRSENSTRRGDTANHRRDDGDRGRRHNHGSWDGDRHYGESYGHRHHHWRGGYNPWWRNSRYDYYDRYEAPHHRRHWWNRYW